MKLTPFGVAVVDGDLLSSMVEQAGTLACADDWLQTFRPYIPDGGTVCDIGAALGDHTASYAAMVGGAGSVYAFEPYQPFLECLQYNTVTLDNVTVSGTALGATEAHGTMVRSDVQPHNLGMTHLVRTEEGSVHVSTLDRVAGAWDRLDFIKIDVEGHEPMVLDGATETIRRWHPVLLIEVNAWALSRFGLTPEDIYRRLRALGYRFGPCRPGETLSSPEIDILCIPQTSPVQDWRVPDPSQSAPTQRRVHLLACPNVQTTAAYDLDGFCTRTRLFAALLKRLGHYVILYGSEENDAPCDEFVTCISKTEQQTMLGGAAYQNAVFDGNHPLWLTFNARASGHIRVIKQPHDLIATIAGSAQGLVAEHHPELTFLEYSIGYRGVAAGAVRVFQSHAWRHCVQGFTGIDGVRLFDAVIPPWFPISEFPMLEPEGYVAYCGRIVHQKGLAIVCEAAKLAGVKLVVVGHGEPSLVTYGEYAGAVSTAERNVILARASAVLMPTQYIEPFGNVAAEAQLCGTPVLSTDMGGFVDSVEPGVSGYHCTSLGEFVQAIKLAPSLDRKAIRARAERLYSEPAADAAYRAYFRRLASLRGDGWRDLSPGLEAFSSQQETLTCSST
jgi:FkbM family methyltransferase